jgi:tRNA-dihydrouridine synthase
MTEMSDMQIDSRIAVAPMMDWTDQHCRYFMRLLSPSALLYTEMVTANAIHFGTLAMPMNCCITTWRSIPSPCNSVAAIRR